MKKLKMIKRILSFVTCCALSTAIITGVPGISGNGRNRASAEKTLEDIQQERQANNRKIADLEVQIGSLEGDKAQEQQYQSVLNEQIGFIQSNIDLLNNELDQISGNITDAETNIGLLDESIADHELKIKEQEKKIDDQQKAIETKVETFKERLCAMYVSGNEQLATILVGTASFYDMLSRVEMVNRIAANDEKLIDDILDEISKMEQYKADLEAEKQVLETEKYNLEVEKQSLEDSLAQQQASKEEKAGEMVTLYDKMQHTQSEIDRLAHEEALLTTNKEELAQINAELDKEEENIKEIIRKAAEEAQRRAEEEARKKAEEEARRKAEEERIAAEKAAAEEAARIAAEKAAAEKAAAEEAARIAAEKKAAEEKAAAEAAAAEAQRRAEEAQRAAEEAAAEAERQAAEKAAAEQAAAEQAAQQAANTVAGRVSSSGFMWPVPGYSYITSGVGPRWGRSHNGIDIGDAGIYGAKVVASRSGTVHVGCSTCTHDYAKSNSCGCGGGYGNYVMIYHDGTYTTLYAHMKSVAVTEGQYVEQGQVIGYVGSTGHSTGAHLHFEVRKNGGFDDPENYVSP
ncbi:MAG: peptidoglycan DD-metalloendopeptidase family protein [Ruminococcus sp.]|nr:peptidoglycan DD-metalloendopeptidase family protein [Ruminococcus sp.]